MKIPYISISRASLAKECLYRYKLKYHLDTPSPIPEPPYFAYGSYVHLLAENYVKNKGEKPFGDLAKEISKEETPKLSQEYKNKLPNHLRAVKTITEKIGYDGDCEIDFMLDIGDERMLKGVIDRLIFKNNKYFILDYKTTKKGKYRKNATTIQTDTQMNAYAYAVSKIKNVGVDKIAGALYYLEGGDLVPTKFKQEIVDSTITELRDTYDSIKNADPDLVVGSPGWHCKNCDFRSMCPYTRCK